MKIAVTSTGKALDSQVDPRFGRAAYFIVVDTETMDFSVVENESVAVGGGAGISSAKVVIDAGAQAVLAGNFGPNAQRTLSAAGMKLYAGATGTVAEAVELFKSGKLTETAGPNVASHFGVNTAPADPMPTEQPMTGSLGQGGGMGLGMGGGRGMGRGGGMGRGMGMPAGLPSTGPTAGFPQDAGLQNTEQELAALKQQVELLEQQKRQLNKRIAEIENGR